MKPLRTRCLADNTDIPPRFWMLISIEEFATIARNGGFLNKSQAQRLWPLLGRVGDAPERYGPILVYKADVRKRWPLGKNKPKASSRPKRNS